MALKYRILVSAIVWALVLPLLTRINGDQGALFLAYLIGTAGLFLTCCWKWKDSKKDTHANQ